MQDDSEYKFMQEVDKRNITRIEVKSSYKDNDRVKLEMTNGNGYVCTVTYHKGTLAFYRVLTNAKTLKPEEVIISMHPYGETYTTIDGKPPYITKMNELEELNFELAHVMYIFQYRLSNQILQTLRAVLNKDKDLIESDVLKIPLNKDGVFLEYLKIPSMGFAPKQLRVMTGKYSLQVKYSALGQTPNSITFVHKLAHIAHINVEGINVESVCRVWEQERFNRMLSSNHMEKVFNFVSVTRDVLFNDCLENLKKMLDV